MDSNEEPTNGRKEDDTELLGFSFQESLGKCPSCGARVFDHGDAYVCEKSIGNEATCDFRSDKVILQQSIDTVQMKKLLTKGETDQLKDFVTKRTGRKFAAWLVITEEGKVGFELNTPPSQKKLPAAEKNGSRPPEATPPKDQDYPDEINVMLDEDTPISPSKMRKLFHKHFDAHMEVVCSIVNHPKCPPDLMVHIAQYGINEKGDFRFLILGGHKFPPLDAISILIDGTEETRNKILNSLSNHYHSSASIVKKMQQSCHELLRVCAISNDDYTTVRLLENSASDEASSVRRACAEASRCSNRILEHFAQDQVAEVRVAAVANSNLKRSSILKHYMDEQDPKVRLSYL